MKSRMRIPKKRRFLTFVVELVFQSGLENTMQPEYFYTHYSTLLDNMTEELFDLANGES